MHGAKTILAFPDNYIVLDLETTGLSPDYDDIIEICAIKYVNSQQVDSFSTLINPGYEIPDFITELTGITTEMVQGAPKVQDIVLSLSKFIGDNIIVGHSICFDANFIRNIYWTWLSLDFENDLIDTLRLARLLHRDRTNNRLSDLSEIYNLDYSGAHRAEFDCKITNQLFNIFKSEYIERYHDLSNISKNLLSKPVKALSIQAETDSFDISHPLYGKVVVFTGTLEKMVRREAMQAVVNKGGIVGDSITKKTNYLILGNNDYCATIKGGKSSKQKKAERYLLEGYDIKIIPENVFYELLEL